MAWFDFYYVSWFVIFINPASAIMLAILVSRFRYQLRIGLAARTFVALLAVGMLMQAFSHIDLIFDYREPRSKQWIVTLVATNGVVWSLFFRTFVHKTGVSKS